MSTDKLLEQPDRMLQSNLRWTSIPSEVGGGGGQNTPTE